MKEATNILVNKFNENNNKGVNAHLKVQAERLQGFRARIGKDEAEIERLNLQINELSRKIDSEPHKNLIENVVKDPKGSNLSLRILEVEVKNS